MRICMVVANPVVFDGRVLRHAQTLQDAGHEVIVLGVRGPNDRDGALPPGTSFAMRRIDRRREGVARVLWATTALRQRAAQALTRRLPAALVSHLPVVAPLAVATTAPELFAMGTLLRCDVYHGNDLNTLPAVAWAARLLGRPYLYDAHELYVDEEVSLSTEDRHVRAVTEGRYAPGAAAVLTVNELIVDELVRLYGIRPPLVLRNLPPLLSAPEPRDLPLGRPGTLRLLYHAANVGLAQEGTDDVLRAMARVRDRLDLHLTIRGRISDADAEALRARTRELGIADRVSLCPPVPGAPALVQAAINGAEEVGLAVHPPACGSYRFTTSSKVYEYQMAGLAVCATEVEGNHLTVDDQAGLFYPYGDDAALAAHFVKLAEDRALLRRMQQSARTRATRELNWESERHRLLDLYAALASKTTRLSASRMT